LSGGTLLTQLRYSDTEEVVDSDEKNFGILVIGLDGNVVVKLAPEKLARRRRRL